jgi:hypothetical protein
MFNKKIVVAVCILILTPVTLFKVDSYAYSHASLWYNLSDYKNGQEITLSLKKITPKQNMDYLSCVLGYFGLVGFAGGSSFPEYVGYDGLYFYKIKNRYFLSGDSNKFPNGGVPVDSSENSDDIYEITGNFIKNEGAHNVNFAGGITVTSFKKR